jgi:hypothetical protein
MTLVTHNSVVQRLWLMTAGITEFLPSIAKFTAASPNA